MSLAAKDVSTSAMVGVIVLIEERRSLGARMSDVAEAFPDIPEKVLRAKLKRLIRNGTIDGCACGCRGDFRVGMPA